MKYSILINTCDAYSDVWNPFFRILEKTWPEAKGYNIFLNTETKNFEDSFFNIKVLNSTSTVGKESWGSRLVHALERIENEYVLFMLEDFFFEQPVFYEAIQDALDCLDHDNRIACVYLNSELECNDSEYCKINKDKVYKGFIQKKQFAQYKISAGPGLWRKNSLIKSISIKDSPWEWEFFGSYRTWFSPDKYYGRVFNAQPVFVYDVYHGGAVHRGKWVGYKVRELSIKYNLNLDLEKRGYIENWRTDKEYLANKPIIQRLPSIIKNRRKIFYSILQGFFLNLKRH